MTETIEATVPIKCVLLGETAVGKTSLINRFVNDVFQENFVPTMVGCYSSKDIFYDKANRKIKYEIWDTAGQEKYRSINKIFYQDASIAILVFDITRKDTFETLKNYWLTEIRDNSPKDIIIAIAANKSDLYEYEEISNDEVEEFANSINALYKQTSAKSGQGIKELFDIIGYKLLSPENYEDFLRKTSAIRLKSVSLSNSSLNNSERSEVKTEIKKNCCGK